MKNKTKLISSLPALKPLNVIDMTTGLYLNENEFLPAIASILEYVQVKTSELYLLNTDKLHEELKEFTGSANSYGRQRGYRIDYTTLPREILAKSRIQELILHKLISETASYVKNPNINKQPPSFKPKLNLGAVNAQMARVYKETSTRSLYLEWKCWDKELLIEFQTPAYLDKRNIIKWSLPTVQYNQRNEIVFYFTIQEAIPTRTGNQIAGVDIGIKEAFTAVVLNKNGARIADYHASNKIKKLQSKKDRLTKEKSFVKEKIKINNQYKMNTNVLEMNNQYLTKKITQLGKEIALQAGHELALKLEKHEVTTLNMESLKWISGFKGSKIGSNHSFQHSRLQDSIEHSVNRHGILVKKVNARNTSQKCHSCKNDINHNNKKRTVYCENCKTVLDRDFNAAMNIALNNLKVFPLSNGTKGREASSNALYGKESTLQALIQKASSKEPQLN